MANKERNKRSARQARQRERLEREALAESVAAKDSKKKKAVKPQNSKKAAPSAKSSESTGLIARTRNYLRDTRAEMRRVTWPGRTELTNYSVAVIAMLIVFGVVVWLVDTGIVAALVAFTSLGA